MKIFIGNAIAIDSVLARKSIKQPYHPSAQVLSLMQEFKQMTNDCIRIGLTDNDASSMKRFSRKEIASKYGRRKTERVKRILHMISKDIVEKAKENKQGIVFEDIRNIRSIYHKGSWQGRHYRRQMNNNWPFQEIKRQVEYKAQWQGVPIIHLTKGETRGTSLQCVKCGERLQSALKKEDVQHERQLWCNKCERWYDRDLVAVMNISRRGWLRFGQSKGEAGEAMVQEPERTTVILKVDASKLANRGIFLHDPKS